MKQAALFPDFADLPDPFPIDAEPQPLDALPGPAGEVTITTRERYEILPPDGETVVQVDDWFALAAQVYRVIGGSPRRSRQTRVRRWEVTPTDQEQLLGECSAQEFFIHHDVPATLS